MCVLLLALGLLVLGSNLGCEASFFGKKVGPFDPHRGIPGVHSSGVLFLTHRHPGYNFGVQHGLPPRLLARLPLPHGGSFGLRINRQGYMPVPRPHVPYQPSTHHGYGGWRYLNRLCPYLPGPLVPHEPVIPSRPTNLPGPVVPSKPLVSSGPAVARTPVSKPGEWPAPGGGSDTPPNKPGPFVSPEPVIPSTPSNPPGSVVTLKPLVPSGSTVPPVPVNKPGEGPDGSAPCGDECDPGINTIIH
ncbi:uncharacterized protein LOC119169295 isoform X2 [Rhipicephalus microplus]|uniref:uncharacterized protein LOC119169295 isoform X2 n=1 Tax=Rhipicephalus microplus TaxID=6941 RepID=UPI003F6A80B6